MARLSFVALALFAVVAAVAAGVPPHPHGGPHGGPQQHPHGLKAWLHAKEDQLKKWGHHEGQVLKAQWKTKVVPHIVELKHKLGAKWEQAAPKITALLKQKAGVAFDKAVQFVNQKLQG